MHNVKFFCFYSVGDSTYSLQDAQKMRGKLVKLYEYIDQLRLVCGLWVLSYVIATVFELHEGGQWYGSRLSGSATSLAFLTQILLCFFQSLNQVQFISYIHEVIIGEISNHKTLVQ